MGISEICSVANGASKKEIGRATKFIVKQLEEDMGISMEMGTIHAGDFLVSTFHCFWVASDHPSRHCWNVLQYKLWMMFQYSNIHLNTHLP